MNPRLRTCHPLSGSRGAFAYAAFVRFLYSRLMRNEFMVMTRLTWWEFNRSLAAISVFSSVLNQGVARQSYPDRHNSEQLQHLRHFRFLSTWMPSKSKTIATKRTRQSVNQLASLFSKITYRGAKTSTRVPASLSASPTISAVYLCGSANRLLHRGSKRTCNSVTLGSFGQLFIGQFFGSAAVGSTCPKTGIHFCDC
jgi:hypothetical protein